MIRMDFTIDDFLEHIKFRIPKMCGCSIQHLKESPVWRRGEFCLQVRREMIRDDESKDKQRRHTEVFPWKCGKLAFGRPVALIFVRLILFSV